MGPADLEPQMPQISQKEEKALALSVARLAAQAAGGTVPRQGHPRSAEYARRAKAISYQSISYQYMAGRTNSHWRFEISGCSI